MTRPRAYHEMKEKARGLRKRLTKGEALLWLELRALRSSSMHFRKQVAVGPYIADFACLAARAIVEVDGDSHETDAGKRHDPNRDAYFTALGYAILRFDERDVLANPWQVAQDVREFVERVLDHPTRPLRGHPPQNGEGASSADAPKILSEEHHP